MSHGLASHFGMQGGPTQLNSTQLVTIAPTPQTRSAYHLTHANPRGASGAARELVLFDSDVMMTLHHVVTMALSALVWYGDQSFAGDRLPPPSSNALGFSRVTHARSYVCT